MKKFILACFMLLPTWANAQQNCAPREEALSTLLSRYGEERQAFGMSGRGTLMEMFANPVTGTWTAAVTTPEGMTCLMDSGDFYEAVSSPSGEEM